MLTITELHAGTTEGKEIVKGLSLSIKPGKIHAIMGPNGSGKSTLAATLAGHPDYQATEGSVRLGALDLLELAPEDRATAGVFLAFQYPSSIPGVSLAQFLKLALNAQEKALGKPATAFTPFIADLKRAMKTLDLPWAFADRAVNEGFSGGEKKRLEALQMLILKPKLVILDEIDSGLDIDALRLVAKAVKLLHDEQPETMFLIITHYQRLLDHITPDHVHIMQDGIITQSGTMELVHLLEEKGYQGILNQAT